MEDSFVTVGQALLLEVRSQNVARYCHASGFLLGIHPGNHTVDVRGAELRS
jgi:hypothetical protein